MLRRAAAVTSLAFLSACSDPQPAPTSPPPAHRRANRVSDAPFTDLTRALSRRLGGALRHQHQPSWTRGFLQPWAPRLPGRWFDVGAHAPPDFDPNRRFHLVMFLVPWGSNATGSLVAGRGQVVPDGPLVPGWGLGARMDHARVDALLLAPQFARGARAWGGWFAHRTTARRWLERTLSETLAPAVGRPLSLEQVDGITLVGSSAGGVAASRIVASDLGPMVRNVVLFDAFYVGDAVFARWLLAAPGGQPRRFVAIDGGGRATASRNRELLAAVRGRLPVAVNPSGPIVDAVRDHRVVIAHSALEHVHIAVMNFGKVLSGLELPERPSCPDEGDPLTPWPGVTIPSTPMRVGETVRGSLAFGDATLRSGALADDYALELAAGETVSVRADGSRELGVGHAPLDLLLRVTRADGRVVAEDDDAEGMAHPRLSFTADRAGRYTLRVTSYGPWRRRGDYTVTVSRPSRS